ncbi:VOC family protein [Streptomyces meridianus]|uniref:VOC family protein n=1 Tax=Streptomyces meridianus TaxID=2938945 RepID=A0ABT0X1C6_9ACTN|nr:VOC family protein [Streptomyces meridianus]MCM2576323.1 VOC family protein [Streptomyces meridianus]
MRGRPVHEPGTPRTARHDWWGVVLEAPDPHALARFYAELLGWEIAKEDAEGAAIAAADGVAYLGFQFSDGYVPPVWPAEEGAQRMTMHLDFEVEDLPSAVGHALELGAREAGRQPQDNVRVMLDPAGHPFCLYVDGGSG